MNSPLRASEGQRRQGQPGQVAEDEPPVEVCPPRLGRARFGRVTANANDRSTLPPGLPVPVDDGACDHLAGRAIPPLILKSSQGPINLSEFAAERFVLYIYPRTGRPGTPVPPGWDDIPGARGCTPESCAFRDHAADLTAFGARVAGLSAQPLDEQIEFAERNHMPFPVTADPERKLGAALALPTFDFDGETLYKRVTLLAECGDVVRVFYPVFPPDQAAEQVVEWLRDR